MRKRSNKQTSFSLKKKIWISKLNILNVITILFELYSLLVKKT